MGKEGCWWPLPLKEGKIYLGKRENVGLKKQFIVYWEGPRGGLLQLGGEREGVRHLGKLVEGLAFELPFKDEKDSTGTEG